MSRKPPKPYLERYGAIFEGLAAIRERLNPRDPSYEAEPLDPDEARWLLAEFDQITSIEKTRSELLMQLAERIR